MHIFRGNIVVTDDVLELSPFVPTRKKEWAGGVERFDDRYWVVSETALAASLKRVSVRAIAMKSFGANKKLLKHAVAGLEESQAFLLGASVAEALYQSPEWPEAWKAEGFKLGFPATRFGAMYTTETLIALVWWNRKANRPEFGYIALCDRTPASACHLAVLEGNALV